MKAAYVLLLIATIPLVTLIFTGSKTHSLLEELHNSVETLCLTRHGNDQANLIHARLKARGEMRKFEPITSTQLKSCKRKWLAQHGG